MLAACAPAKVDETRAAAYTNACFGGDTAACSNLAGLYTKACNGGAAMGCQRLGDMFLHGRGVSKDEARAATLYTKACDGGDGMGCAELAGLFEQGRGVDKSPGRAKELCTTAGMIHTSACDQGDAKACAHLGVLVLHGRCMSQEERAQATERVDKEDEEDALKLFTKACEAGNGLGCDNLGLLYQQRGVMDSIHMKNDDNTPSGAEAAISLAASIFKEAAAHYTQACIAGEFQGCGHLGNLLGSPGVDKDEARAVALYTRACDGGDAPSCASLGIRFLRGRGVDKDEATAAALFTKVCDWDDVQGCTFLGMMFEEGNGMGKDETRAAALYAKTCDGGSTLPCDKLSVGLLCNGNTVTCGKLGRWYEEGRGVGKDEGRAANLYAKACDGRHLEYCFHLGRLYEEGRGIAKDEARAADLYTKACDQLQPSETWRNLAPSCFHLGRLYEEGRGVGKDEWRAAGLFAKACAGGDTQGCSEIGRLPKEVVQQTVRQGFSRMRLCYTNGLRNHPNLQGRVSVRFVIRRDGNISKVDIDKADSTVLDDGVISCVVRAYYGLSFPRPEGGMVPVAYAITFSPAD